MDDQDRIVIGDGIQVVACRMAQLRELGVVVAEADDQLCLVHRRLVGCNPVTQHLLQRGDVRDVTVRRGEEIGRERLQPTHHHVAVGIHEARQQRAPVQVDQPRVRPAQLHHLVAAAHRDDPAVLLRNGLGAHRRIVHGQDAAARPDAVRGLREGAGAGQQQCGGHGESEHRRLPGAASSGSKRRRCQHRRGPALRRTGRGPRPSRLTDRKCNRLCEPQAAPGREASGGQRAGQGSTESRADISEVSARASAGFGRRLQAQRAGVRLGAAASSVAEDGGYQETR